MNKDKKFEILFVCTGNTCRSSMAEGLLKKALKQRGFGNVNIGSAGTNTLAGSPATLFAVEVAKDRGVDISGHSSRKLSEDMLEQADLVLVMSQAHLERIKKLDRNSLKKTYLLKLFPEKDRREGDFDIRDPIGGTLEDYNQVLLEMEEEITRILPHVEEMIREGQTK